MLAVPNILDFETNTSETVSFFDDFRKRVLREGASEVIIDHANIERVSANAALVLIAEIIRAVEYAPRCRFRGNAPKNPDVCEMFGETGYFEYFRFAWKRGVESTKEFLVHRSGRKTDGKLVDALVKHFQPEIDDYPYADKLLYAALVECMDNVMKHAYPKTGGKYLFCQWWLIGFRDRKNHEVSFCFYDQGVGIPNTIRTRLKDRLGIFSASDGELVIKAVVEGHYSSTKDPKRGRGLPALKRFLDNAPSGKMMIVTDKCRCIFERGAEPRAEQLSLSMGGTLIVWTVQTKRQ